MHHTHNTINTKQIIFKSAISITYINFYTKSTFNIMLTKSDRIS